MMLKIRTAAPEDFESIRALIYRSARILQAQYYTQAEIEVALELVTGIEALIDSGCYFVAEREGVAIGCGGVCLALMEPAEAEIRAFFVAPEFARRGVASRVLQHCEDYGRENGVKSLFLTSTLSGELFYKKSGYVEMERFSQQLSGGQFFKLVKMKKIIK